MILYFGWNYAIWRKEKTNILQQADFFKNDTQHMIYEELLLSSMGWQSTGKTVKKKKKSWL